MWTALKDLINTVFNCTINRFCFFKKVETKISSQAIKKISKLKILFPRDISEKVQKKVRDYLFLLRMFRSMMYPSLNNSSIFGRLASLYAKQRRNFRLFYVGVKLQTSIDEGFRECMKIRDPLADILVEVDEKFISEALKSNVLTEQGILEFGRGLQTGNFLIQEKFSLLDHGFDYSLSSSSTVNRVAHLKSFFLDNALLYSKIPEPAYMYLGQEKLLAKAAEILPKCMETTELVAQLFPVF